MEALPSTETVKSGDGQQAGLSRGLWPALLRRVAVLVIAFVRRTGLRILALEPGRVVCEMPLRRNRNHIGTMYAGALFTLAEFPGGALFLATFDWRRYIPIVTELKLDFVSPARGPVRFEMQLAAAEISRIKEDLKTQGKAAFEYAGTLTTADGTVVARSHACYQIRRKR